jgi:glutathione S-transferase
MKLIGSLTSPFVRKVRVVMAEKKIDYQLVLENVWAADTRIDEYNPLGKVPCLVMEDGEGVFDSRVICEYVDTMTPVGKLIPPGGRERAEVRCWEALGDGVNEAAALVRQELTLREAHQQSSSWIERQTRKIENGLEAMAKGLGEKAWCASNHLTLADISVGCALGYLRFRMPDFEWQEKHPNLAKHFDKLMQRASFADTVPHD